MLVAAAIAALASVLLGSELLYETISGKRVDSYGLDAGDKAGYLGGAVGSLISMLAIYLLEWHNVPLRLSLIAVGFIAGLCVAGMLYDNCFHKKARQ
jgi:hypothetical protein